MKYRDSQIQYDAQDDEPEVGFVRESADARQYRRKRSFRGPRKRPAKAAASSPGCGIGARRQRRWTW